MSPIVPTDPSFERDRRLVSNPLVKFLIGAFDVAALARVQRIVAALGTPVMSNWSA